jgi:hypothetical protein
VCCCCLVMLMVIMMIMIMMTMMILTMMMMMVIKLLPPVQVPVVKPGGQSGRHSALVQYLKVALVLAIISFKVRGMTRFRIQCYEKRRSPVNMRAAWQLFEWCAPKMT